MLIGFVGRNGVGKKTLTKYMIQNHGYKLFDKNTFKNGQKIIFPNVQTELDAEFITNNKGYIIKVQRTKPPNVIDADKIKYNMVIYNCRDKQNLYKTVDYFFSK